MKSLLLIALIKALLLSGCAKEGPSAPSQPRFAVGTGKAVNCVTDALTGLMWLRNPDAVRRTWSDAVIHCEQLDGSEGRGGYEDWRMPTLNELRSLIEPGDLEARHPFTGIQADYYWAGTTYPGYTGSGWLVYLENGHLHSGNKSYTGGVWPVRDGP